MTDWLSYLLVGILLIVSAWVPLLVGRIPVSLPMVAVGAGLVLSFIIPLGDLLRERSQLFLRLSEAALIISVLNGGLRIDRRFSWFGWGSTWRLLTIVMALSIAAIAAGAYGLLHLTPGIAITMGAMLAPTDPVLASSVGVGPPGSGEGPESNFALSSEAGLNDGLAYPFVTLGLLLASRPHLQPLELCQWLAIHLLWNVCGGVVMGVALGWMLVRVNDLLPQEFRLSATNSGLVSVGLAALAYGVANSVEANGFVAVFCEGCAIRNFVSSHEYSRRLSHAADQFERLAMVGVLLFLGLSIANGLFAGVGIRQIGFALIVMLAIRPVMVAIGFVGSGANGRTRAAIGYFGIRGIASLYYAAYVGAQLTAAENRVVTAVAGIVVLISVVLYGTTTDLVSRLLLGPQERRHGE